MSGKGQEKRRIAGSRLIAVGVLLAVAVLATVGTVLASGGGTKVCLPNKEGRFIKTAKGGSCSGQYKLTELGAEGKEGAKGATGSTGPQGSSGSIGPPGPAGASSPLVFGPYQTSAPNPDGSECGGNWANDEYERTFIVSPMEEVETYFVVTELFKGTFTTLAGKTPGYPCGTLSAGIKGTFYGMYIWIVEPHLFNPAPVAITDPGACAGSAHFNEAHFGITPSGCGGLQRLRWQFHYTVGAGGAGHEWTNAEEPVIRGENPSHEHAESEGNIEG